MKCSYPPPLTDDQISDALDDLADRDVRDHLAGCAACAARLAQAQQAERTLRAGLNRWDCPPAHLLGDYHLQRVSRDDARAITRHLAECARCTEELDELRLYLPAGQVTRAPVAMPARAALGSLGKLFGQILPRTPAHALRGAGPEPIVAEADGTTIILDVQPAPDARLALQGQVVAEDLAAWAGALVELRQSGALLATGVVSDLGGFSCGPLPAGLSELRITPQRGRMLILADLQLSA